MSATTYAILPQNQIYSGVPASFFLAALGLPAADTTVTFNSGAGVSTPILHSTGAPAIVNVTYPAAGTYNVSATNNQGLVNPYNVSTPLVVTVLAGPIAPSLPTQVLGLIQTDDGFGNPVSASVNISCFIEPANDYSAGSTSTLQVTTNSSGGVYQDFVVGRTYLLWLGTGASGKTSLIAPSQPFSVNMQPGP